MGRSNLAAKARANGYARAGAGAAGKLGVYVWEVFVAGGLEISGNTVRAIAAVKVVGLSGYKVAAVLNSNVQGFGLAVYACNFLPRTFVAQLPNSATLSPCAVKVYSEKGICVLAIVCAGPVYALVSPRQGSVNCVGWGVA